MLDEELAEIERFHSYIQNTENKKIGEFARNINHITDEQLEGGITIQEMRETWERMTADTTVFIAHNIEFDTKFLQANGFNVRTDITLDTMHISRDVFPREGAKLVEVYARIGKTVENAHDALYDCEMVADFLRWLVDGGKMLLPLSSFPIIENHRELEIWGYKMAIERGIVNPLTNK